MTPFLPNDPFLSRFGPQFFPGYGGVPPGIASQLEHTEPIRTDRDKVIRGQHQPGYRSITRRGWLMDQPNPFEPIRLIDIDSDVPGSIFLACEAPPGLASIVLGRDGAQTFGMDRLIPSWGICFGVGAGHTTVDVRQNGKGRMLAGWGWGWPRQELEPRPDITLAAGGSITLDPPVFAVAQKFSLIAGVMDEPIDRDEWAAAASRTIKANALTAAIFSPLYWLQCP
jgi:hypothetical protein